VDTESGIELSSEQRAAMLADYECLRLEVLERKGGPRRGRAVIERRGMAAWIEAWSALPEPSALVSSGGALGSTEAGEAVSILAGMALCLLGGAR
jgi:hypothetical protein